MNKCLVRVLNNQIILGCYLRSFVVEKLNFKFGLFLGGLYLLNLMVVVHSVISIVLDPNLSDSIRGSFHVFLIFLYHTWISEILDQ